MAAYGTYDSERQEQLEQELLSRLGEEARPALEAARERVAGWTEDDYSAAMADFHERLRLLSGLRQQDLPPDAPEVQELIGGHHEWLSTFWSADWEAYTGLAGLYVEDERFRAQIEGVAPGLAAYLRDAMTIWAERHLD